MSDYLGHLAWYTCSIVDNPPKHEEVLHALMDHRLAFPGMAPKPPADADVFRRVVDKDIRRQLFFTPDLEDVEAPAEEAVPIGMDDQVGPLEVTLMVRNAVDTRKQIVKKVVVEVKGETLRFVEVVELTWSSSGTLDLTEIDDAINELPQAVYDAALAFGKELRNGYLDKRQTITAQGLRDCVKRGLDHMLAVTVREAGAVFFVAPSWHADLLALRDWAHDMPGVAMHIAPLVDEPEQRQMVQQFFESEIKFVISAFDAELDKDWLDCSKGVLKVSHTRFAKLRSTLDFIIAKNTLYSGVLQHNDPARSAVIASLDNKLGSIEP